MTRLVAAVLTALVLGLAAQPVLAARVALVIGNGAYLNTAPLASPKTDTYAFADFLRANDFDVTETVNADRATMAAAVAGFISQLNADDTAIFFFAGHAMQMEGKNYLLGVDARLVSTFDVAAETVELSQIVAEMEERAAISMIFIDASHANPLAAKLSGIAAGLAPMQTMGDGTLVAFSAAPGQVSAEGAGGSPFTTALIANLAQRDLEVGTAFKRVIRDVRDATEGKQIPQVVSTMSAEFYVYVDQPVLESIVIEPLLPEDVPTPTVTMPEPSPAPTTTTVAALPEPVVTEPPAAVTPPAPTPLELDLVAAKRIGTYRALQLFLRKHSSDPVPFDEMSDLISTVAARMESGDRSPQAVEDDLGLSDLARNGVQRLLTVKGYDTGTPDGVFGPSSRRQIAAFQQSQGEKATGYVTLRTLRALGLPVPISSPSPISSRIALRYASADIKRLEIDQRLATIDCLSSRPLVYGFFEDHLYIAVSGDGDFSRSDGQARRCGGHLATASSKEENEFMFSLVRDDPRFFNMEFDKDGGWVSGPLIGLVQPLSATEPRGGWAWSNGEPLTYSAWAPNQPDDHNRAEDYGHYWFNVPVSARSGGLGKVRYVPTWNDSMGGNGFIMEIEPIAQQPLVVETTPAAVPAQQVATLEEAPKAEPETTVAIAPPPEWPKTEEDFAAAARIMTVRGWMLFMQKHASPEWTGKALAQLANMGAATPENVERSLELSTAMRKKVQQALLERGYSAGTPDGVFGPATRQQVGRYQSDLGETDTGYLTPVTLMRLKFPLELPSDRVTRSYLPEDIAALETDRRVVAVAECLEGQNYIYGFFEDHLYVAVRNSLRYSAAVNQAKTCGGTLVSFSSGAENRFVFDMIAGDKRLFQITADGGGQATTFGPYIGFHQPFDANEPRGGWLWATGETSTYSSWAKGEPSDSQRREDAAVYMAHDLPLKSALERMVPTWGDVEDGGTTGYIIEIE